MIKKDYNIKIVSILVKNMCDSREAFEFRNFGNLLNGAICRMK